MLSHEDVLRVIDPLNFTKISSLSPTFNCSQIVNLRRSFTWTNVVTRTDDLIHIAGKIIRWRSSDCRRLHFEPDSARFFSSPSRISIVWSNCQIYIHRLLWSLSSLRVTLSPYSHLRLQLSTLLIYPQLFLIGWRHDVIDQPRRWLVSRHQMPLIRSSFSM